jgi:hypothetical protein
MYFPFFFFFFVDGKVKVTPRAARGSDPTARQAPRARRQRQ